MSYVSLQIFPQSWVSLNLSGPVPLLVFVKENPTILGCSGLISGTAHREKWRFECDNGKKKKKLSQSAAVLSIIYCFKHKYSTNLLWTKATSPPVFSFAQKESFQPFNQLLQLQIFFLIFRLLSNIKLNNKQATHTITIPSAASICRVG